MTCPNCGAPVADNRRFCGKCGTDLAPPAPDPAGAAPMSPAGAPAGAPPTAWGSTASPYAPPPPPADAAPPTADPFAPPDLNAPPGYGPPPVYPPPPYGAPSPYPPPGAPGPWAGAPYGYAGPPTTNGLAVTSLILGLVGPFTCGVGSVVAIVLGFVAREQIKRSWGRETGSGMATAGIILGFLAAAFWLVLMIVAVVDSAGSAG